MKENRRTTGRKAVSLLLAFALLIGVLPIRVFAQSGVDMVVQTLQGFNVNVGNRLIITPQGSTVTVTATQDFVSFEEKTLKLTIPEGVTVDWKATVSNSTFHTLIEMSEESRGTFRLTAGKIIAGNSGNGIKVFGGNFELSGGVIDAGDRDSTGIWVQGPNSRFTFSSGTVTMDPNAQGLKISNGGTAEINGGQILCSKANAQAILVDGRSKLTISGGNIVLQSTGQALKISNQGTAHIKGGQILCSLAGAKAIVMDNGNLTISDGLIRCDNENTIELSNQSNVNISGGMIRNSGIRPDKFVLKASNDSSVTVTGGSIKGNVDGLTAANLTNGAGKSVYKVTLEGLRPADLYTVELLSPQGYGVKGIDLRTDDKLYFYVPAGKTEFKLNVGSKTYYGKVDVKERHNNTVTMSDKYIKITKQPESLTTKAYAPNLKITLQVKAMCENPITYQWYSKSQGGNFEAIQGEKSSTLTLRNLDVGRTAYHCLLNASGAAEVETETSVVNITKASYDGQTTGNKFVKSDQVENVSYTLPTLPQGMSWGAVTVGGTAALIDGAPTVSGNVLSFKTTAKAANTSATIKVIANGGVNYHDSDFTLTVTAKDKTAVEIKGLTAKNAIYNGQPQRGYSGTAQTAPYSGALEYKYEGRNATNYAGSAEAPTDAGEYTVTVSVPSTDTNYAGSVSFDFTIAKRKVRVKADNKSMIKGQALPPLTYTVAGQVSGETALNGSQPQLSTTADGNTPGTFDVNVDMAGVGYTANYEADNPAFEKGTLTVKIPTPFQPRYEISVSPTEWDFGRVLQNEPQKEKEFVVRNTGNQSLRSLSLNLSGEDADKFELSERSIERLEVYGQSVIKVSLQRGLPIGVYRANLEIQGSPRISERIPLQFEVVSFPIEGEYMEWEMKTEVPLTKEWNIKFNKKLDKTTVMEENVFLVSAEDLNTKILANIRISEDGTIVHIRPKQPLDGGKKYFLIIQKIKGESGTLLRKNIVMPFKTV